MLAIFSYSGIVAIERKGTVMTKMVTIVPCANESGVEPGLIVDVQNECKLVLDKLGPLAEYIYEVELKFTNSSCRIIFYFRKFFERKGSLSFAVETDNLDKILKWTNGLSSQLKRYLEKAQDDAIDLSVELGAALLPHKVSA